MSEYDTDILLWSEHQARLLRRRAAGALVNDAELDWLNIAEEIESVGKTAARELAGRISTILVHLMKLAVSPAIEPRIGWRKTVREQRAEIDLLLDDAPSLRQTMGAVVGKGWTRRRIRCGRHWRIMVKSRALTWAACRSPRIRCLGIGFPKIHLR